MGDLQRRQRFCLEVSQLDPLLAGLSDKATGVANNSHLAPLAAFLRSETPGCALPACSPSIGPNYSATLPVRFLQALYKPAGLLWLIGQYWDGFGGL